MYYIYVFVKYIRHIFVVPLRLYITFIYILMHIALMLKKNIKCIYLLVFFVYKLCRPNPTGVQVLNHSLKPLLNGDM